MIGKTVKSVEAGYDKNFIIEFTDGSSVEITTFPTEHGWEYPNIWHPSQRLQGKRYNPKTGKIW